MSLNTFLTLFRYWNIFPSLYALLGIFFVPQKSLKWGSLKGLKYPILGYFEVHKIFRGVRRGSGRCSSIKIMLETCSETSKYPKDMISWVLETSFGHPTKSCLTCTNGGTPKMIRPALRENHEFLILNPPIMVGGSKYKVTNMVT